MNQTQIWKGMPTLIAALPLVATGLFGQTAGDGDERPIEDLEHIEVIGLSDEIAEDLSPSSKIPGSILETPRSLSVMNAMRIEDTGAWSIQDSLSYMPGVLAGPFGVDSRLDSARIRGASPLKFQDGFQALFGFYNNTKAEIFTLEQVEVVKGPASVLFGRGALAGVVNSVSKLPKAEASGEVQVQLGSFDRFQVGVDSTGRLDADGKWLYRVVGLYRESGTQVDWVPDDLQQFMPSLTWKPRDSTSLTLLVNLQENQGGQTLQFLPNEGTLLPGRPVSTSTFIGEPGWDRYDTEQEAFSLFFNHAFNEQIRLSVNGRYTEGRADYKSHWVAYDGADPLIADDGTVNRTIYDAPATTEAFVWNASLNFDFSTGPVRHELGLAVDVQDVTIDTDSYYGFAAGGRINIYEPVYGNLATVGTIFDAPASITDQVGFSLRDSMTLDNWILTGGLRHDRVKTHRAGMTTFDIDASATTGDVGLLYAFDNGFSPYLSWTESFEPLGTAVGLDGSLIQLDPKEGRQVEAGIKYQPVGSSTLFTLAVFDLEETERPLSNGVFVEQATVLTEGIEFEVQSQWRDFYVQLGYSYIDATGPGGVRVATIPDHQAVAWVTYDPTSGPLESWDFGGGVRHVGENWDGADTLSTDPYTLFDAMASYTTGPWHFRLNARNLADSTFVATTQGGRSYYGERRRVTFTTHYRF